VHYSRAIENQLDAVICPSYTHDHRARNRTLIHAAGALEDGPGCRTTDEHWVFNESTTASADEGG